MTITPFNVLASLPHGTKLEAISGTILRIGRRSTGTNSHGEWAIQIVDMQDATGTAKILLKDRPELPTTWQGHAVLFSGDKSIAIDDYQKDPSKPVERRIKVTPAADMQQAQAGGARPGPAPQTYQQPAPQYQQQPQPAPAHYQPAPQPGPQPQPQHYQQPSQPQQLTQQTRHQDTAPLFAGPTIGMAVNNACALILAANDGNANFAAYLNSREFSVDLHNLTSDILRVTKHLENGNIAPPAKDRAPLNPEHYPENKW